jgi:hypothetical protein
MERGALKKSLGMTGIATVAAVGLGIAPAANAATPATHVQQWHVIKSVNEGQGGNLTAVVATGPASGWAFESSATGSPVAYERTGATTWKAVTFPGGKGQTIAFAEATSPSDVWVFAEAPNGKTEVYSLKNRKWTLRRSIAGDLFQATVVSARNVTIYLPGAAYHYNGSGWTTTRDSVSGGYALSASDAWTCKGTKVTHAHAKTNRTWNLKSLLPAPGELNDPQVAAIYAYSDSNVYAIGDGNAQDAGGPVVVLHYDGHKWAKLAGNGPGYAGQVTPDGSGGLWIRVGWDGGGTFLHFSDGKLIETKLPSAGTDESTYSGQVSAIPGTNEALATANVLPYDSGTEYKGEILQYS